MFANDGWLVPLTLLKADAAASTGASDVTRNRASDAQDARNGGRSGRYCAAGPHPGYRVAGKTGTAYKIKNGQYVNEYVASFVGFAPVSDPRIVVAVMIDEPAGHHYGGQVAAPVFAQITASALRTLQIAPDAPLEPGREMVALRKAP